MKLFKKILFWTTSPITFSGYILFMIFGGFSERCLHFIHMYEAWCFNYHEKWTYLGDGIWKGKDRC